VNIVTRIFPSESAALRPRLACEITPSGVVAARPGTESEEVVSAFAALQPGIFIPGLKPPIFGDRAAVASALRQALDAVSLRDIKVTLIVPDSSVRVLLLDFDSLPPKAAEALPILRFRLRKLVSFDVDDAAVSYQIMSKKDSLIRTIVAVTPAAVLAEYESAVREAGYEPGAVLPSTLAALAALDPVDAALVVNSNGKSVTTAIARQNQLLLHRTLELAAPEPSGEGFVPRDLSPEAVLQREIEELQQAVSVAIAYFEDTLSAPPEQLLACGFGGAQDLAPLLGEIAIPARDLVPAPATGFSTPIPRGVLAGVVGALAG
jgi:type IV pilus assembly protein PilM